MEVTVAPVLRTMYELPYMAQYLNLNKEKFGFRAIDIEVKNGYFYYTRFGVHALPVVVPLSMACDLFNTPAKFVWDHCTVHAFS